MKNSLWIVFTVVAGFVGFLLGYSVPPMMEINNNGNAADAATGNTEPVDDQELLDYYKELQELK